jgi:CubicO group peptidase (beta-lactamase class C family)
MTAGALSKERLDHLREVMNGYVDRRDLPGLVTVVARGDDVHIDAFGTLAVGSDQPMRPDTIFRIASMSKAITAAAAMMLVEESVLRLDEPVDRWLPELAGRRVLTRLDAPLDDTVPARRPITTRDLLAFTMGMGIVMAPPGTYPIQDASAELELGQGAPNPRTPPAPDEWIRRLGTLPLMHHPSEQWMYHTGSDVLGVLVARASGQPLEAFLRERIFEPLGMKDTGFSVPADQLDRLATAYWTSPDTGELTLFDEPNGQWSTPPAFPSGGGGLVSTAADYLAFGRMMVNNGRHNGERILSKLTVETMTTDQVTDAQKQVENFTPGFFDRNGWGFGVSINKRRHDTFATPGSYGWSGGLGTTWISDPAEDMVTIVLTQGAFTSPDPPKVIVDFLTAAYMAIDD